MSLLVVGSVAFDEIETPFGQTGRILGGSASFITLTASYFLQPVRLVAAVGGDFPKENIQLLERHGVDTLGLQVHADKKSFYWKGRYHNDMNTRDSLVTELNILAEFDPLIPAAYLDTQFVLLGNLHPALQRRVLEQFPKRPKLVVMDTMNFWMDIALDELLVTLKLVDVLSINDEEARQLSGEYSLVKAAKKILSMGPKILIIKKGEHGALLFNQKEIFFAPALPLDEVFDPTGAGDSFAGGFLGHLARTGDVSFENMKRAIIYGSAMASFCVGKFGTDNLVDLTQTDIEDRVQEFIDLVQFEMELR